MKQRTVALLVAMTLMSTSMASNNMFKSRFGQHLAQKADDLAVSIPDR